MSNKPDSHQTRSLKLRRLAPILTVPGSVLENGTKPFEDFVEKHNVETIPGTRSIIIVHIHQVGSSCGFSVPYFDFKGHRDVLNNHFLKKQEKFEQGNEKESMPRLIQSYAIGPLVDDLLQILGIQECVEYGWPACDEGWSSSR